MDIEGWLRGLGLEQYAPAFRDNDIDAEVLPRLTPEDLTAVGILSVGHRRKLLDAVAALRDEPGPAGERAAQVTAKDPVDIPVASAERRQLTVMFCDLVGSTALASRLDPEDLREVIGAYHKCVAQTIGRFEGFVAKYMGDGVLVYFGYPQAHEDDAERAVRAGLAVIEAVRRMPTREALQVRIGLATGLAVVGDLIGSGAAQEQAVIGETPNLAARLQALAGSDEIVIPENTRRLIGSLFEYESLGEVEIKGLAAPVAAFRVIRESQPGSRFEALRSGETPLIGRDEELELLLRQWKRAKTGDGRVVLISGEPGIGKSRLTVALLERIGTEPHAPLRYFALPHHQYSALYPFIAQLERAAGFAREDTMEAKVGKLRALLEPGTRGDDDIALLSELLSLPSSAADLNLSPQRKREKLFEALLHQLEAETQHRPALMVFEDAHWIDPTSGALLDLTVDRVKRLPVLLVITFRPEFEPPWDGRRSHVTTLALDRLGERDGEALVQKLAGDAALTKDIVAEIVERTDGVPLFVEELTKAVLESGDLNDRVSAVLGASQSPALAVPATLQGSLIARLDRLGPTAKEVAQVGSVIGREFGYDLVERVAQRPASELRLGLERLSEAGLLLCSGVAPQSIYLFKHALVLDAAYGTLLRAKRQELHDRVAAVLELHFADVVERQPELLAHHLTAAGDTERAVDQWLKAGQHAAERSAHLEAIRHFERGLATLAALPEGPTRDGREIELQLARGLSLLTAKGFASAGAAEAYARARELAERRDNTRQLFTAVYGLWQSTVGSGMVASARGLSDRLLRLTEGSADDGLRLQAHHSAWSSSMFAGEPAAAREHCEAGRRLYDPERHRSHRLLYGGHDPGVCARCFAAHASWQLGYPERGLALSSEALALAERIAHPFSLLETLLFSAMLHLDRREPEFALRWLDAAAALATEQRLGFVLEPLLLRGGAVMVQGSYRDAVTCLRQGLEAQRTNQTRPLGFALLAEAMVRQTEHGAALATARDGLKAQEESGHRLWDAELHRLEGIALSGLNRLEEGQHALEEALRIARKRQAKSYELRAGTALARLWSEQGQRTQARDLLAPIYGWFTEGLDTPDLKEAKALLEELG